LFNARLDPMGLISGELHFILKSVFKCLSISRYSSIPFFEIGEGKFIFASTHVFSRTCVFGLGAESCFKPRGANLKL